MKNLPRTILVVGCVHLLIASAAFAQIDPTASSASIDQAVTLLVLPDGNGDTIGSWGATLSLNVVDVNGNPVTDLVAADIEVDGSPPNGLADGFSSPMTHNLVAGGFNMGQPGEYTVTAALYAGGWSNGAIVKVRGQQITSSPLSLDMNSPDISGDGVVNLVDAALFTQDVFGTYHFRSDFEFDGVINLLDLGLMSSSIGIRFPAGYVVDPTD